MYTASDPGTTRRELAYSALKHGLLMGDFPPGRRLGEERLGAELGVSRTPIREALSRLHSEGLVERLADGGYGPTLVDLHLVRELYEIRFALERCAVRRPGHGGTPHDRAALLALLGDWTDLAEAGVAASAEFVLLDEDFHERVAAAAGNGALVGQLRKINERIRIVRMHDFLTEERVARTIDQHQGVLASLLDGDLDEAEARLVRHFDESLAVVEDRAAVTIARMLGRGSA
ncbi:MAG: GntR family transcriptional regulator [Microthrixaceae bacterium]